MGAVPLAGDLIPAFHFAPDAQEVFVIWLTAWQHGLETGDDTPALVQHLAKYRKLYPALALLFHLLDLVSGAAAPGPVSQSAATLAERWCAYFAAHARRLYAYGASGGSTATLGEHLRAGHLPAPFALRDVQRKGWQGLTERSAVQSALDDLTELGWIREVPPLPPPHIGRPLAPTYCLNPSLQKVPTC